MTEKPGRYILFIDDSPADYHLLLESLKQIDFKGEIEWLDDGQDAMDLLKRMVNPPDLIILDINLPNVNGHAILQYLKSDAEKRKTPVIIFSSSNSHSDIDRSYANHANGYVVKPEKIDDYVRFAETIRAFWLALATLPTAKYRPA